jgi:hypothetical protein
MQYWCNIDATCSRQSTQEARHRPCTAPGASCRYKGTQSALHHSMYVSEVEDAFSHLNSILCGSHASLSALLALLSSVTALDHRGLGRAFAPSYDSSKVLPHIAHHHLRLLVLCLFWLCFQPFRWCLLASPSGQHPPLGHVPRSWLAAFGRVCLRLTHFCQTCHLSPPLIILLLPSTVRFVRVHRHSAYSCPSWIQGMKCSSLDAFLSATDMFVCTTRAVSHAQRVMAIAQRTRFSISVCSFLAYSSVSTNRNLH